ncbi:hypothetical protein C8F01DRAFT_1104627 [Mycena amicta]|nr:hypothetical protein C8F01DRAFT_1104627 [Mycena amicta]
MTRMPGALEEHEPENTEQQPKPKLTINTSMSSPAPENMALDFVLTPELLAVGELASAMRRVVSVLSATFNSLEDQAERVATLAPALKASEQLKKLRAQLEQQLCEQELRAFEIRQLLDEAVKQSLSEQVKAHVSAMVGPQVKERVAQQLGVQIPEHLRQKIKTHKRQILEVQLSLHNSEARRYNSALGPDSLTKELRPLLRPLPTADQSPMPGSLPSTPVPVSSPHLEEAPSTASPLFPRDLQSLFALKSEEAETLVHQYGLGDLGLPVTPLLAQAEVCNDDSRERNLNKFMAHIGVSRHRVPNPRFPRLHIVIPGGEQVAVTTYY